MKTTSSVIDVHKDNEGTAFGTRLLSEKDDVFEFNAWDSVEWDDDQEAYARQQIERHSQSPVPVADQDQYHDNASEYWDKFYKRNENRFFKDRNWLRIEFPELFSTAEYDASITLALAGRQVVMEIGCGAGNTMFPLLAESKNDQLFVYACDFSRTAVEVVQANPAYDTTRSTAFVWDLASETLPSHVAPESVDIIVLIFVLSALRPLQWKQAVNNIYTLLKPGGRVLFRDYGRYDLAQLRFKEGRMLSENFYIRGDGTRVYFFTSEEVEGLFADRFEVEQNAVDRRLIVNRSRKLKMYRVWLQGKFKKRV